MSADLSAPAGLDEVARLCTLLADRTLDAQIAGRPIPPEQVTALAQAASLLRDYDMEWPPLLAQVLHDLVERSDEADREIEAAPPVSNALGEVDLRGLTRFFSGFRKEMAQPR